MAVRSLPPADPAAIYEALWTDDYEVLNELLREHSIPLEFEESGLSPLSVAASVSDKCCRCLLEHGADPNFFNLDGTTPLLVAIRNGNDESSVLLLKWGAKAHLDQQSVRIPPMNWVCERGQLRQLTLLLETTAESDRTACFLQRDYLGLTPIHEAARRGCADFVRMLSQHGCDVNLKSDIEGKTPLHSACEQGAVEVVETLLDLGADVDITDIHGRRPVDYLDPMIVDEISPEVYKRLSRPMQKP